MTEPPNASSRKSIREAEKAARIRDIQRREVIGEIMSTRPGRAWLWDMLASTSMFHTTFSGDPYASAFQEGRRSVGLSLLADILAHCPDQYITAMREQNERHLNDHDPSARTADAERRSGPLADGGDSGALADPDDPSADDPDRNTASSIGADIYTASGTQAH